MAILMGQAPFFIACAWLPMGAPPTHIQEQNLALSSSVKAIYYSAAQDHRLPSLTKAPFYLPSLLLLPAWFIVKICRLQRSYPVSTSLKGQHVCGSLSYPVLMTFSFPLRVLGENLSFGNHESELAVSYPPVVFSA